MCKIEEGREGLEGRRRRGKEDGESERRKFHARARDGGRRGFPTAADEDDVKVRRGEDGSAMNPLHLPTTTHTILKKPTQHEVGRPATRGRDLEG